VSQAPLVEPEIQARLISEALLGASVGLLVWDEERRYIAANEAACEILGTSLDDLLGQIVGDHTQGGAEAAEGP
jgi:PAS domain-containing protein